MPERGTRDNIAPHVTNATVRPPQGYDSRTSNRTHGVRVSGTGIGASSGQITDSGNGLGSFQVGERCRVKGSAGIDGHYLITAVAAGALTVDPPAADETAGASIVVERV